MLQRTGEIQDLTLQKSFVLIQTQKFKTMPTERAVRYIADFTYIKNGVLYVEDTKGYKTRDYILKRKMFKDKYCQSEDIIFLET